MGGAVIVMDNSKDRDWISASDAMQKYVTFLGGRSTAGDSLAEYLRDGTLNAKADEYWMSKEETLAAAWKNKDERAKAKKDVVLPKGKFQTSDDWLNDRAQWRWPVDKFSITYKSDPIRRRMMAGVRFYEPDLIKLAGAPNPRSGGSPGKPEAWVAFWHAVVSLAKNDRLNRSCFPSKARLRREILVLTEDSLSESSIKPQTGQIWEKFCKD